MSRKTVLWSWFVIFAYLSYHSWTLNFASRLNLLSILKPKIKALKTLNMSPQPGYPISLFLGYVGVAFMLVTVFLLIEKRFFGITQNSKRFYRSMNLHIFSGLVGPTFILFHSNFKIGGIAGAAFWCMIIVTISGAFGELVYPNIIKNNGNTLLQKITGYWPSLHLPFCIILTVLSFIHIAVGLLFKISR